MANFPFSIFRETYTPEDNTIVELYSDDQQLFSGYMPRTNPKTASRQQRVKVSLIATALDEAENISAWVNAILNQTRLPDEIVVTDTGSVDGSYQILTNAARSSPIPFKVLQLAKGNIAQGRNHSIQESIYEVIAVTDFGVIAHPDWLERLIAPFEIDPKTEVSGGWYRAMGSSTHAVNRHIWQKLNIDNPKTVLSPGASIAFTRDAWERVGGFPEWLTLTGEDTYFDMELRRCVRKWAFVPQAMVDWQAPISPSDYWKKAASWASGDGETGLHARYYLSAFLKFSWTLIALSVFTLLAIAGLIVLNPLLLVASLAVVLTWLLSILILGWLRSYSVSVSFWQLTDSIAQVYGYLAGTRRRMIVNRRRLKQVKGFFFVLAGVPVDDTGGGSRFAQIALEMTRQQFAVIYLYKFPKGEHTKLNLQIRHPNLFHLQVDHFDLAKFLKDYDIQLPIGKSAALVEVPLPEWIPILNNLADKKVTIIYDLVDDWETNLGGNWYKKEVETQIARTAKLHTATVPELALRLEKISEKPVTLLPNAVNLRLFNPQRWVGNGDTPKLPVGANNAPLTFIYTGALYGSWFDWETLIACAEAYPKAAVLVIGDYNGQCPKRLPNLYFLGLKKQTELPGYLAIANVTIIPWKIDPITLAVSPLKIYEYLAMEKPVVAPNLPLLKEIPGVCLSADRAQFIQNISTVMQTPFDREAARIFLQKNSWEVRVKTLSQMAITN